MEEGNAASAAAFVEEERPLTLERLDEFLKALNEAKGNLDSFASWWRDVGAEQSFDLLKFMIGEDGLDALRGLPGQADGDPYAAVQRLGAIASRQSPLVILAASPKPSEEGDVDDAAVLRAAMRFKGGVFIREMVTTAIRMVFLEPLHRNRMTDVLYRLVQFVCWVLSWELSKFAVAEEAEGLPGASGVFLQRTRLCSYLGFGLVGRSTAGEVMRPSFAGGTAAIVASTDHVALEDLLRHEVSEEGVGVVDALEHLAMSVEDSGVLRVMSGVLRATRGRGGLFEKVQRLCVEVSTSLLEACYPHGLPHFHVGFQARLGEIRVVSTLMQQGDEVLDAAVACLDATPSRSLAGGGGTEHLLKTVRLAHAVARTHGFGNAVPLPLSLTHMAQRAGHATVFDDEKTENDAGIGGARLALGIIRAWARSDLVGCRLAATTVLCDLMRDAQSVHLVNRVWGSTLDREEGTMLPTANLFQSCQNHLGPPIPNSPKRVALGDLRMCNLVRWRTMWTSRVAAAAVVESGALIELLKRGGHRDVIDALELPCSVVAGEEQWTPRLTATLWNQLHTSEDALKPSYALLFQSVLKNAPQSRMIAADVLTLFAASVWTLSGAQVPAAVQSAIDEVRTMRPDPSLLETLDPSIPPLSTPLAANTGLAKPVSSILRIAHNVLLNQSLPGDPIPFVALALTYLHTYDLVAPIDSTSSYTTSAASAAQPQQPQSSQPSTSFLGPVPSSVVEAIGPRPITPSHLDEDYQSPLSPLSEKQHAMSSGGGPSASSASPASSKTQPVLPGKRTRDVFEEGSASSVDLQESVQEEVTTESELGLPLRWSWKVEVELQRPTEVIAWEYLLRSPDELAYDLPVMAQWLLTQLARLCEKCLAVRQEGLGRQRDAIMGRLRLAMRNLASGAEGGPAARNRALADLCLVLSLPGFSEGAVRKFAASGTPRAYEVMRRNMVGQDVKVALGLTITEAEKVADLAAKRKAAEEDQDDDDENSSIPSSDSKSTTQWWSSEPDEYSGPPLWPLGEEGEAGRPMVPPVIAQHIRDDPMLLDALLLPCVRFLGKIGCFSGTDGHPEERARAEAVADALKLEGSNRWWALHLLDRQRVARLARASESSLELSLGLGYLVSAVGCLLYCPQFRLHVISARHAAILHATTWACAASSRASLRNEALIARSLVGALLASVVSAAYDAEADSSGVLAPPVGSLAAPEPRSQTPGEEFAEPSLPTTTRKRPFEMQCLLSVIYHVLETEPPAMWTRPWVWALRTAVIGLAWGAEGAPLVRVAKACGVTVAASPTAMPDDDDEHVPIMRLLRALRLVVTHPKRPKRHGKEPQPRVQWFPLVQSRRPVVIHSPKAFRTDVDRLWHVLEHAQVSVAIDAVRTLIDWAEATEMPGGQVMFGDIAESSRDLSEQEPEAEDLLLRCAPAAPRMVRGPRAPSEMDATPWLLRRIVGMLESSSWRERVRATGALQTVVQRRRELSRIELTNRALDEFRGLAKNLLDQLSAVSMSYLNLSPPPMLKAMDSEEFVAFVSRRICALPYEAPRTQRFRVVVRVPLEYKLISKDVCQAIGSQSIIISTSMLNQMGEAIKQSGGKDLGKGKQATVFSIACSPHSIVAEILVRTGMIIGLNPSASLLHLTPQIRATSWARNITGLQDYVGDRKYVAPQNKAHVVTVLPREMPLETIGRNIYQIYVDVKAAACESITNNQTNSESSSSPRDEPTGSQFEDVAVQAMTLMSQSQPQRRKEVVKSRYFEGAEEKKEKEVVDYFSKADLVDVEDEENINAGKDDDDDDDDDNQIVGGRLAASAAAAVAAAADSSKTESSGHGDEDEDGEDDTVPTLAAHTAAGDDSAMILPERFSGDGSKMADARMTKSTMKSASSAAATVDPDDEELDLSASSETVAREMGDGSDEEEDRFRSKYTSFGGGKELMGLISERDCGYEFRFLTGPTPLPENISLLPWSCIPEVGNMPSAMETLTKLWDQSLLENGVDDASSVAGNAQACALDHVLTTVALPSPILLASLGNPSAVGWSNVLHPSCMEGRSRGLLSSSFPVGWCGSAGECPRGCPKLLALRKGVPPAGTVRGWKPSGLGSLRLAVEAVSYMVAPPSVMHAWPSLQSVEKWLPAALQAGLGTALLDLLTYECKTEPATLAAAVQRASIRCRVCTILLQIYKREHIDENALELAPHIAHELWGLLAHALPSSSSSSLSPHASSPTNAAAGVVPKHRRSAKRARRASLPPPASRPDTAASAGNSNTQKSAVPLLSSASLPSADSTAAIPTNAASPSNASAALDSWERIEQTNKAREALRVRTMREEAGELLQEVMAILTKRLVEAKDLRDEEKRTAAIFDAEIALGAASDERSVTEVIRLLCAPMTSDSWMPTGGGSSETGGGGNGVVSGQSGGGASRLLEEESVHSEKALSKIGMSVHALAIAKPQVAQLLLEASSEGVMNMAQRFGMPTDLLDGTAHDWIGTMRRVGPCLESHHRILLSKPTALSTLASVLGEGAEVLVVNVDVLRLSRATCWMLWRIFQVARPGLEMGAPPKPSWETIPTDRHIFRGAAESCSFSSATSSSSSSSSPATKSGKYSSSLLLPRGTTKANLARLATRAEFASGATAPDSHGVVSMDRIESELSEWAESLCCILECLISMSNGFPSGEGDLSIKMLRMALAEVLSRSTVFPDRGEALFKNDENEAFPAAMDLLELLCNPEDPGGQDTAFAIVRAAGDVLDRIPSSAPRANDVSPLQLADASAARIPGGNPDEVLRAMVQLGETELPVQCFSTRATASNAAVADAEELDPTEKARLEAEARRDEEVFQHVASSLVASTILGVVDGAMGPAESDPTCVRWRGLVNHGNTCYLNSLVQQLFCIPRLRYAVLGTSEADLKTYWEEQTRAAEGRGETFEIKFPDETLRLQRSMATMFALMAGSASASLDPRAFIESIRNVPDGWFRLEWDVMAQNDVAEFFSVLCDRIDMAFPHPAPRLGDVAAESEGALTKSIFGGQTVLQMTSGDAARPIFRQRPDDFLLLALEVRGRESVEASLTAMTKPEVVDAYKSNAWGGISMPVKMRTLLSSLPDVLVIQLKRFDLSLTTFTREKIHDELLVPEELDVWPYTVEGMAEAEGDPAATTRAALEAMGKDPDAPHVDAPPGEEDDYKPVAILGNREPLRHEDSHYRLRGVLVHLGEAGMGHYYSFVQERPEDVAAQEARAPHGWSCPIEPGGRHDRGGRWIELNDLDVSEVSIEQVMEHATGGMRPNDRGKGMRHREQSGFLLFYDRVESVRSNVTEGEEAGEVAASSGRAKEKGAQGSAGRSGDAQLDGIQDGAEKMMPLRSSSVNNESVVTANSGDLEGDEEFAVREPIPLPASAAVAAGLAAANGAYDAVTASSNASALSCLSRAIECLRLRAKASAEMLLAASPPPPLHAMGGPVSMRNNAARSLAATAARTGASLWLGVNPNLPEQPRSLGAGSLAEIAWPVDAAAVERIQSQILSSVESGGSGKTASLVAGGAGAAAAAAAAAAESEVESDETTQVEMDALVLDLARKSAELAEGCMTGARCISSVILMRDSFDTNAQDSALMDSVGRCLGDYMLVSGPPTSGDAATRRKRSLRAKIEQESPEVFTVLSGARAIALESIARVLWTTDTIVSVESGRGTSASSLLFKFLIHLSRAMDAVGGRPAALLSQVDAAALVPGPIWRGPMGMAHEAKVALVRLLGGRHRRQPKEPAVREAMVSMENPSGPQADADGGEGREMLRFEGIFRPTTANVPLFGHERVFVVANLLAHCVQSACEQAVRRPSDWDRTFLGTTRLMRSGCLISRGLLWWRLPEWCLRVLTWTNRQDSESFFLGKNCNLGRSLESYEFDSCFVDNDALVRQVLKAQGTGAPIVSIDSADAPLVQPRASPNKVRTSALETAAATAFWVAVSSARFPDVAGPMDPTLASKEAVSMGWNRLAGKDRRDTPEAAASLHAGGPALVASRHAAVASVSAGAARAASRALPPVSHPFMPPRMAAALGGRAVLYLQAVGAGEAFEAANEHRDKAEAEATQPPLPSRTDLAKALDEAKEELRVAMLQEFHPRAQQCIKDIESLLTVGISAHQDKHRSTFHSQMAFPPSAGTYPMPQTNYGFYPPVPVEDVRRVRHLLEQDRDSAASATATATALEARRHETLMQRITRIVWDMMHAAKGLDSAGGQRLAKARIAMDRANKALGMLELSTARDALRSAKHQVESSLEFLESLVADSAADDAPDTLAPNHDPYDSEFGNKTPEEEPSDSEAGENTLTSSAVAAAATAAAALGSAAEDADGGNLEGVAPGFKLESLAPLPQSVWVADPLQSVPPGSGWLMPSQALAASEEPVERAAAGGLDGSDTEDADNDERTPSTEERGDAFASTVGGGDGLAPMDVHAAWIHGRSLATAVLQEPLMIGALQMATDKCGFSDEMRTTVLSTILWGCPMAQMRFLRNALQRTRNGSEGFVEVHNSWISGTLSVELASILSMEDGLEQWRLSSFLGIVTDKQAGADIFSVDSESFQEIPKLWIAPPMEEDESSDPAVSLSVERRNAKKLVQSVLSLLRREQKSLRASERSLIETLSKGCTAVMGSLRAVMESAADVQDRHRFVLPLASEWSGRERKYRSSASIGRSLAVVHDFALAKASDVMLPFFFCEFGLLLLPVIKAEQNVSPHQSIVGKTVKSFLWCLRPMTRTMYGLIPHFLNSIEALNELVRNRRLEPRFNVMAVGLCKNVECIGTVRDAITYAASHATLSVVDWSQLSEGPISLEENPDVLENARNDRILSNLQIHLSSSTCRVVSVQELRAQLNQIADTEDEHIINILNETISQNNYSHDLLSNLHHPPSGGGAHAGGYMSPSHRHYPGSEEEEDDLGYETGGAASRQSDSRENLPLDEEEEDVPVEVPSDPQIHHPQMYRPGEKRRRQGFHEIQHVGARRPRVTIPQTLPLRSDEVADFEDEDEAHEEDPTEKDDEDDGNKTEGEI